MAVQRPWKMQRAKRLRLYANFPEEVNRAVSLIYANIFSYPSSDMTVCLRRG